MRLRKGPKIALVLLVVAVELALLPPAYRPVAVLLLMVVTITFAVKARI